MKAALLLAVALAACAHAAPEPVATIQRAAAPRSWRAAATPFDRGRLRDWRAAWTKGLLLAREAGHGAAIDREGSLLMPDAALPGAALPDGAYRCRVIKLGGQSAGMLHFVAYPAFECRVNGENGLGHFVKLTGSQRPSGHIFPDSDTRSVFLGTLILGDEQMAMKYGQDRDRDLAGVVERVGPRRWRLVLPFPRFESIVDVVELVPSSAAASLVEPR